MASLSGYGKTIKLHSGDALVVHHSRDSRILIQEYEVHGRVFPARDDAPPEARGHAFRMQFWDQTYPLIISV
jgi:hypothetical protein